MVAVCFVSQISIRGRVLTKKEENQLLVFERKVLRTIFGPKQENGVYRRRYNFELQKKVRQPVCQQRREDKKTAQRWSHHDQKSRIPTTEGYFYRKTGRNEVARNTGIQEDGVNRDSRALEASDGMNRDQDRELWKELLRQRREDSERER
jgi:hypothetical protein